MFVSLQRYEHIPFDDFLLETMKTIWTALVQPPSADFDIPDFHLDALQKTLKDPLVTHIKWLPEVQGRDFATCPVRVLFGRFRYVACGLMGSRNVSSQPRYATMFLSQLLPNYIGFKVNANDPRTWDELDICLVRAVRAVGITDTPSVAETDHFFANWRVPSNEAGASTLCGALRILALDVQYNRPVISSGAISKALKTISKEYNPEEFDCPYVAFRRQQNTVCPPDREAEDPRDPVVPAVTDNALLLDFLQDLISRTPTYIRRPKRGKKQGRRS
ncbi:hypothetical protein CJU90_4411 [Yarrowia sp. C11]|nr:hypothetical protein CKK34_6693 [Yarrowia sp. E02]KAG5365336.1 hypothetical protein CJU90_4411 [Yarrowia sp. C11]